MSKKNKVDKVSPETQTEALKIARATQRPGQSKEQTRLISQGIEKGIAHYKKQQKAKSRELNKKLQKIRAKPGNTAEDSNHIESVIVKEYSKLPWLLLLCSWVGFAVWLLLNQ